MRFMRKLREALKTQRMDKRKMVLTKLDTIAIEDDFIPQAALDYQAACEYRIDCIFGRQVFSRNGDELAEQREMILRDIAESIYGGVRDKLRKLEFAIYNDDREEIRDAFREIYNEMDI